jgi:hypothetical protein
MLSFRGNATHFFDSSTLAVTPVCGILQRKSAKKAARILNFQKFISSYFYHVNYSAINSSLRSETIILHAYKESEE